MTHSQGEIMLELSTNCTAVSRALTSRVPGLVDSKNNNVPE